MGKAATEWRFGLRCAVHPPDYVVLIRNLKEFSMCRNESVSGCDHRPQSRNDICQCFLADGCCELCSLPTFHHVGSEPHGAGDGVV